MTAKYKPRSRSVGQATYVRGELRKPRRNRDHWTPEYRAWLAARRETTDDTDS